MTNTHQHLGADDSRPLADYPALAALRLTASELALLRRQGFVGCEERGTQTVFKLRFRKEGKQQVRCIPNAAAAARVRAELASLQAGVQAARQLRKFDRQARRALRDAKRNLAPLLADHGLAFHGLAVRRPRHARMD